MRKKPESTKEAEILGRNVIGILTKTTDEINKKATEVTSDIDKKLRISEGLKESTQVIKAQAVKFDERRGVSAQVAERKKRFIEGIQRITKSEPWKSLGIVVRSTHHFIKDKCVDPAADFLRKSRVNNSVKRTGSVILDLYGKARSQVKPYYAPETPDELLRTTRKELLYINACILQISEDEAAKFATRLGSAVASKIAGAATAGAVMGLVSAFGSASTGTAIATLYGSAHTTTALWWVGSLFGGGAAAGAAITGGLSLVVGIGVYKLLGSEARKFEDLSNVERQVVESFAFLTAAIDDTLTQPELTFDLQAAESLLNNTLKPMLQLMKENESDICRQLDRKNAAALQKHGLIDFEKAVIDGFQYFIDDEVRKRRARFPEFAIAGALYSLLTDSVVSSDREDQLALTALRRVNGDWQIASEHELSEILSDFSPEQLAGVASNAKGIYHELLFTENYNFAHTDTRATLHEATNHAGSDIQIWSTATGELVNEIQLKAGSSVQIIQDHFAKYPDIPVSATEEIAAKIDECASSGISNIKITREMNDMLDSIADNTIIDRISEATGMAGLAAAGMESVRVMKGSRPLGEAGKQVLASMGVAAGSSALVAMLFG